MSGTVAGRIVDDGCAENGMGAGMGLCVAIILKMYILKTRTQNLKDPAKLLTGAFVAPATGEPADRPIP